MENGAVEGEAGTAEGTTEATHLYVVSTATYTSNPTPVMGKVELGSEALPIAWRHGEKLMAYGDNHAFVAKSVGEVPPQYGTDFLGGAADTIASVRMEEPPCRPVAFLSWTKPRRPLRDARDAR